MILPRVDRGSPTPLFQQIVSELRRLIDGRSLAVGEALPSSRRLAERLGVNRSTVCRAYQELWSLGYLDSRSGAYTRVRRRFAAAPTPSAGHDPRIDWASCSSVAGREVHQRFLRFCPEPPAAAGEVVNLSRLDLDPRLFPVQALRRSLDRVLGRDGGAVLGYGDRQGLLELRAAIADRARTHGIEAGPEQVLITNGSQQAIDLVLRVLCSPRDRIALEEPTYANVLPLVGFHQLEVEGIPMGPNGLDLGRLEQVATTRAPALLYTIPNFHNPTGVTTAQSHREAVLELCERHRLPLVEDGFEEEMKYFGRVALPIKAMDRTGTVVYLGTFSKVLFPGLRVGWMIAARELVERVLAVKRFTDLSTSALVQAALADFCRHGHYEHHIRRVHRVFRRRMQVALDAARRHLPGELVRWTEPAGGYLIWVSFRDGCGDETTLQQACRECKVAVSPGSYYFANTPAQQHFRVSISMLDEDEIAVGIERLGDALRRLAGGG